MKHYHFREIDSTNSWAKRELSQLARDEMSLVTAEKQTEGRGRHGRSWESPAKGNIYATFVLFEERDPVELTHALVLAAALMLEQQGIEVKIKWPNDLLLAGKKIAGVLCEVVDSALIIGIGMNVNMPRGELNSLDQPATSLRVETGQSWNVEALTGSLSDSFLDILQWSSIRVQNALTSRLVHLGE